MSLDLTNKKVLHLTLTKEWFGVMVTGEKTGEYRKRTKFILDRLFNRDGPMGEEGRPIYHTRKRYDYIRFTNGYGAHRPYFIAEFRGFREAEYDSVTDTFSNGKAVRVEKGDFIISIFPIVERGNLAA